MKFLTLWFTMFLTFFPMNSQEVNYDESKVPSFILPELLRLKNGEKVTDSGTWMQKRRPEIRADFESEMFGKIPGELKLTSWKVLEQDNNAFKGKATRKQINLTVKKNSRELNIGLLLYIPNSVKKATVFLGYNFYGNHTICDDPAIISTTSWTMNEPSYGIVNNHVTEQSRGVQKDYWCVEKLIDSGFGLATVFYGDVDPDRDDFSDGVHPFFYAQGQNHPLPDEWGSISAWAWGLSRVMDYLEHEEKVDSKKVILMGHSRLGKAALWAGALDQRFAIVISNNSGCGGAALSRRAYGETVEAINKTFPYWFCTNFKKYNGHENDLPIDQHELIALIAPRPVYIASAVEDRWADPKGEYLSGYYASEVYQLFGLKGLTDSVQPPLNTPVMNQIGYHIREGGHKVTEYDWEQYIRFVRLHLK
jgi:hypothetical protein